MDKMDKIKLILIGYPGSQFIVPASRYLVQKYLPFETHWLNYTGDTRYWSRAVKEHLETIPDKEVIFALDDYLIGGFDEKVFKKAISVLSKTVQCVKLFHTNKAEHQGYPVTTQYCLWNKEFLIDLLEYTTTPWSFELEGSEIFKQLNVRSVYGYPAIQYNTSSCLSARWQGVDWEGVKPSDMEYILNNHLI